MNFKIFLIISFFFTFLINKGQSQFYKLDSQAVENLKITGVIWGFIKYHHPNVAKGKYDLDKELIQLLPKINESNSRKERDSILLTWIESLGSYKEKKYIKEDVPSRLTPDFKWLTSKTLSTEIVNKLESIKEVKRKTKHHYIGLEKGVKNPVFKNENSYQIMNFPEVEYRLLALYRYWNIIQYYYPYRYNVKGEWIDVLDVFIPKFIGATSELEYKLLVQELITYVNDSHARITNYHKSLYNYFGKKTIPVKVGFVENQVVVIDYLDEELGKASDLVIGDIILEINEKKINSIIEEKYKYISGSNHSAKLRDLSNYLTMTNDSLINIKYLRNNVIKETSSETFSNSKLWKKYWSNQNKEKINLNNDSIAYIKMDQITSKSLRSFFKKNKNYKKLIIDLRCYPSEFLVFKLSKYLLPSKVPFATFTRGSVRTPGKFYYTKPIEVGKKNKNYFKGDVVILINERTQSQAEYTAMAFQKAPKAKIIGSNSVGADGNVSIFYLPGGIKTMISGIGVYYPNYKETQCIGIIPDIQIRPTINGIIKGKDTVLEFGINQ